MHVSAQTALHHWERDVPTRARPSAIAKSCMQSGHAFQTAELRSPVTARFGRRREKHNRPRLAAGNLMFDGRKRKIRIIAAADWPRHDTATMRY